MDVLNRALALLALLLALVGPVLVLLLRAAILSPAQVGGWLPYQPVSRIARDLAHPSPNRAGVTLAIAVIVLIAALIALLLELWPRGRGARSLILRADELGRTGRTGQSEISYRSLDDAVARAVRGVSGVDDVLMARVRPRGGTLTVSCSATVHRFIDEEATRPRVQQTVAECLQCLTGLTVRDIQVEVETEPRARRQGTRRQEPRVRRQPR